MEMSLRRLKCSFVLGIALFAVLISSVYAEDVPRTITITGGEAVGDWRLNGDQLQRYQRNNSINPATYDWLNQTYQAIQGPYQWQGPDAVTNTLNLTGNAYNYTDGTHVWSETILGTNNAFSMSGSAYFVGSLEIGSGHISITGASRTDTGTKITAIQAGAGLTTTVSLGSMNGTANGYQGSVELATKNNTLNLNYGAHAGTGSTFILAGATENIVNIDLVDPMGGIPSHEFNGQIDLSQTMVDSSTANVSSATAVAGGGSQGNVVNITSGRLVNGNDASIIGSLGTTRYNIRGGNTNSIDTNDGIGLYDFAGGTVHTKGPLDFIGNPPAQVPIDAQVYNIWNETSLATDKVNLEDQNTANAYNGTVVGFNGGDYLVYSLLNVGKEVNLTGTTTVTIGAINYKDNDMNGTRYDFGKVDLGSATPVNGYDYSQNYVGNQAQISANQVNVSGGSKLIIHENFLNFGNATIVAGSHNIINELNIDGEVTLDRTSIYSYDPVANLVEENAQVNVRAGGTLRGFGHYTSDANHTPLRDSVYGNVLLEHGTVNADGRITQKGGELRPYDETLFDLGHNDSANAAPNNGERYEAQVRKLMGVVMSVSGDIKFENTSYLSTRLFHQNDVHFDNQANWVEIDGADRKLYYSDSVHADTLTFTDIWSAADATDNAINQTVASRIAQAMKAQYNPVFGFNYELRSKLDFELYKGDPGSDTQTYYYRVATSDNVIEELYKNLNYNPGAPKDNLMADANHLFNRMILKSDMLGEWYFTYTEDRKDIVLRFRLLADHPHNGGFVVAETERNNILPGKYLDEIRYPFWTDSSWLNLPSDYAGDLDLPRDPSMPHDGNDLDDLEYNHGGYTGDMVSWYANITNPFLSDGVTPNPDYVPAVDNYRPEWIQDWEDLLHGFQLEIISGRDMRRGLRMLHAESYANLSNTNFDVMSQFIRNRERNSVTALFQVESNDFQGDHEVEGTMFDPVLDAVRADRFVANPVRFWAAAFGTDGKARKSGSEYGYNLETWGGSVGAIKEMGDVYAGGTIGFARSRNTWDDLPSSGVTKSYMAEALVGARLFGLGFAELHANYSYGEQSMSRIVELGGYYSGWAKGEFNDHTFGLGARIGYQQVFRDNWLFIPTLGIQALHYRNGAFSEYGRRNMANLLEFKDGSMNRTMVRTPLLLRLSRSIALGGVILSPEIRGGVTPLWGATRGKAVAKWIGNPFNNRYFTSYGADRGNYELEAGATLELSRRGRFYVAGNYDLIYTKNSTMHNFSVQAGLNF